MAWWKVRNLPNHSFQYWAFSLVEHFGVTAYWFSFSILQFLLFKKETKRRLFRASSQWLREAIWRRPLCGALKPLVF